MTSKMKCIFASNLLENAPFKNGVSYDCYRDQNKKVFVKCSIGIDIELVLTDSLTENKTVWGCENNGIYHFERHSS